ncbi:MAG: DNA polymerase III subunit gamma/tau [Anaerolineaceae bacterium]|nr:DNA polymerase III subunit gamma/tau [Anaerolineaceae bacterium]
MSQALYRTWRPALWEEVVGQDHIVTTLKNAIASDKVGHAYLFAGPRGTGKTTSARLLAKAVNCLDENPAKRPCNRCENCLAVNEGRFLDLIEIDAASNTSVDDIRDLRDKINFSPSQGRFKVYIIDEVHMLSSSAFNALLKTLEEPPAHVIFILATTEIHKIPATVLSRCQRYDFRRIPVPIIIELLKNLCKQEQIKIDEDALALVARQATGAMRDAISLIDQLSSVGKKVDLAMAQDLLGTAASQSVIHLVDSTLEASSAKGLEIIQQTLDSGSDPRQFARQVVDYLRSLMVIKLEGGKTLQLTPEQRELMTGQAERFTTPLLIKAITAFGEAATDLKANWFPGLSLELAFTSTLNPTEQEAIFEEPNQPASTQSNQAVTKTTLPKPGKAQEKGQPAPELSLSFENLRQQWDLIRKRVSSENVMVGALINSSELVKLEGNVMTISFKSELLRDKMNDEKNLKLLKKVLNSFFKQDILVASTVGQTANTLANMPEIVPGGLVEKAREKLGAVVTKVEKIKKENE